MLNWTCPTGEQWQEYLLDPGLPHKAELDRHLKTCPYCRFLVNQLQRDLNELARPQDEPSSVGVIRLALYNQDLQSATGTRLLAAEGQEETQGAASVTLSSPDEKLFMRAIRDKHTNETWLYFMAEDMELCRNVLVKPFGGDREYITDDRGRVNLGRIDWPVPERMTAEAHLPKAVFVLSPYKDITDQSNSAEFTSEGGDRIRVSLSGRGPNCRIEVDVLQLPSFRKGATLRMGMRVSERQDQPQIQLVDSDMAIFESPQEPTTIEIFLFQ